MQTTKQRREAGFHVVEFVVVLFVVAVVGVAGYSVWSRGRKTSPATTANAATVPEIKTAKDLDTAKSTVDQLDTTASTDDLTSLEQELGSL